MSEDAVDAETVEHIAGLARINLADEEIERFSEQFADILESFETLDQVPAVDPDVELSNVMRPDEVEESLDQDVALQNAPEHEDGRFRGPNVS